LHAADVSALAIEAPEEAIESCVETGVVCAGKAGVEVRVEGERALAGLDGAGQGHEAEGGCGWLAARLVNEREDGNEDGRDLQVASD